MRYARTIFYIKFEYCATRLSAHATNTSLIFSLLLKPYPELKFNIIEYSMQSYTNSHWYLNFIHIYINNCRNWESVSTSICRAQSAVICNESTDNCARFFSQNETRIDGLCGARIYLSGAIGGNEQSMRLFCGRNRR